jgi:transcriptional regulator GlxA family with amidase domain
LQKARKSENYITKDTPLLEAMEYAKKNFRKKITVEELAELIHISPKYFTIYFSKNTGGISLMKYLNKLRVDYAASLLAVSDMTVEQIAFDAGFCSSSYFSRIFKKYYNMSPLEYRKSEGGR